MSTSELRPYSCHDLLAPDPFPVPTEDGVDEFELDSCEAATTGDVTVIVVCGSIPEDAETGKIACAGDNSV